MKILEVIKVISCVVKFARIGFRVYKVIRKYRAKKRRSDKLLLFLK